MNRVLNHPEDRFKHIYRHNQGWQFMRTIDGQRYQAVFDTKSGALSYKRAFEKHLKEYGPPCMYGFSKTAHQFITLNMYRILGP